MEIKLSDIWTVAGVLIALQISAFAWRVSREITVSESGDVNWLPLADIMNLCAMVVAFLGVFVLPLAGIRNSIIPRLALGLAIILFAGYPFALAGHYDLYTRGPRSYKFATKQEIISILVTIVAAIMFLIFSLANSRTISDH